MEVALVVKKKKKTPKSLIEMTVTILVILKRLGITILTKLIEAITLTLESII